MCGIMDSILPSSIFFPRFGVDERQAPAEVETRFDKKFCILLVGDAECERFSPIDGAFGLEDGITSSGMIWTNLR